MSFGSHVTKQQSDWPEIFGMVSQGIGPKIPDHLSTAILLAEMAGWERDYVQGAFQWDFVI